MTSYHVYGEIMAWMLTPTPAPPQKKWNITKHMYLKELKRGVSKKPLTWCLSKSMALKYKGLDVKHVFNIPHFFRDQLRLDILSKTLKGATKSGMKR